jgi:amino acid adenylation domain-containing protein
MPFTDQTPPSFGPRLLHRWLLRWAGVVPDQPAVLDRAQTWSYRWLEHASELCARRLAAQGVRPRDRVLVRLPVSAAAVAALCGCSRLGATFVVLSPDEPAARVQQVRHLVDATFEIDASSVAALVAPATADDDQAFAAPMPEPLESELAYILFTSGSSGVPKGIAMPHRAAVAVLRNASAFCGLGPGQRLVTTAPLQFDFSLLDFGIALGAGAALVIPPRLMLFQPAQMLRFIDSMAVDQVDVVPSIWRLWFGNGHAGLEHLSRLRTVLFGGEGFTTKLVEEARQALPALRVINAYGPSECIACCFADVAAAGTAPTPALGWGHAEAEVLLIGKDGQALNSPGEEGEIVVAGPTLFRGYWRDDAATGRALRPHPARPETGELAYFTGDLAKVGDDGQPHFLGRRDQQVKINGNRVEVEEIEGALLGHEGVAAAAAVAVAVDDRSKLVAFVVPKQGSAPGAADLRERCARQLPRYMVPSEIVFRDSLPLLEAGKLDRAGLRRLVEQGR